MAKQGTRSAPDHRSSARSACSLAMALLAGGAVDAQRYDCELRSDPAPAGQTRTRDARRMAFKKACDHLRDCGFALAEERVPNADGTHVTTVRLNAEVCCASPEALERLDAQGPIVEDLAHILVALADASGSLAALDAHGAAAKLLRDFNVSGPARASAPANNRNQRTLRVAMAKNHVVRVRYRKEDGEEVERVLEPIRHVLTGGYDFLVAVDRGDGLVKTFHYRGFLKVRDTGEGFIPREVSLERLFNPPFAYTSRAEKMPGRVAFLVPAERVARVKDELRRLFCDGQGTWRPAGGAGREGDLVWRVDATDPGKAATFAIANGIEVLSPTAYRVAYLDAIEASRKAFAADEPTPDGEATGPHRPGRAAASDDAASPQPNGGRP